MHESEAVITKMVSICLQVQILFWPQILNKMISKIELLRRWKVFIRFALYRGASYITLKELYESKCSCGKLLKDHHNITGDDDFTRLKLYYDIGTCKIPKNKEVWSTSKYIDLGHHKYYFLLDKSKDKYELRERYHLYG